MQIKLGVVMDPIDYIKIYKDSTFAMLLAAQRRGWHLSYMELGDLSLQQNQTVALMRTLQVMDNSQSWFKFSESKQDFLNTLDIVLMRKDPPFDIEYLMATHILEQAEKQGVLVVNRPASLRDANEKLFALNFPQCCPPTIVTRKFAILRDFYHTHGDIILKPLNAMGGTSVFRLRPNDPNTSVIFETLTDYERCFIMAQKFIPEIAAGDKRVLMIDGVAVPYALARIPAPGEVRGNLAAGGTGIGIALSAQDQWIAAQVGPTLRERGIVFAGLDIIGNYLTEINVTSPTCIRELDRIFNLDIADQFLSACERKLTNSN
jgi:glutathione synthase